MEQIMEYQMLHDWTLLRALMILAIAATFLVFAGIVVWYKAWREADRRDEARTGNSSRLIDGRLYDSVK
jgi:hypothetical protein